MASSFRTNMWPSWTTIKFSLQMYKKASSGSDTIVNYYASSPDEDNHYYEFLGTMRSSIIIRYNMVDNIILYNMISGFDPMRLFKAASSQFLLMRTFKSLDRYQQKPVTVSYCYAFFGACSSSPGLACRDPLHVIVLYHLIYGRWVSYCVVGLFSNVTYMPKAS